MIVWDLDRTLGVFDAIERGGGDNEPLTVLLRPGIHEALAKLSAEGFLHVVLTLATPSYADIALRGTGLFKFFAEIACAGQRMKGDAAGLAAAHGVPHEEMHDRMIFVGDHPWFDAPKDPRIVFHIEPSALRRSAAPLADLILELRRLGAGSIRRGFDALCLHRAEAEPLARVTLEGIGPLL